MDCNSARRLNDKRCGPQAHHFAARRYPPWLWPAGSIMMGSLTVAGFCLVLIFLFLYAFPARAAERQFNWNRYHEDHDVCAEQDRIGSRCAHGVAHVRSKPLFLCTDP
jgi:hypothetical protein